MCVMYYIHIAALDNHSLKIHSDFVINSFSVISFYFYLQ